MKVFVGSRWVYEHQIFANAAAEKIGVLRYKSNLAAQVFEADVVFVDTIV